MFWAKKGAQRTHTMSTQEVFVQQFTRLFHHYSSALSCEQPEDASRNSASREECNRLVAAARLAILELETNAGLQDDRRRYFARPGEAEWGC
jgi:hypothetical protein